jgi:hypothetical protein
MKPNSQNKPADNPGALRDIQQFFSKINRRKVRTLGDRLAEDGPEAVIVALGVQTPGDPEVEPVEPGSLVVRKKPSSQPRYSN